MDSEKKRDRHKRTDIREANKIQGLGQLKEKSDVRT
jgi:hypothetical protein